MRERGENRSRKCSTRHKSNFLCTFRRYDASTHRSHIYFSLGALSQVGRSPEQNARHAICLAPVPCALHNNSMNRSLGNGFLASLLQEEKMFSRSSPRASKWKSAGNESLHREFQINSFCCAGSGITFSASSDTLKGKFSESWIKVWSREAKVCIIFLHA